MAKPLTGTRPKGKVNRNSRKTKKLNLFFAESRDMFVFLFVESKSISLKKEI